MVLGKPYSTVVYPTALWLRTHVHKNVNSAEAHCATGAAILCWDLLSESGRTNRAGVCMHVGS